MKINRMKLLSELKRMVINPRAPYPVYRLLAAPTQWFDMETGQPVALHTIEPGRARMTFIDQDDADSIRNLYTLKI